MTALRRLLDRLLDTVLVALLAGAVANVSWQIFARFVLASPSSVTDELARILLIWLGLLGAARVVGSGAHLSIGLLRERTPESLRRPLAGFCDGMILLFASSILLAGGARLVWITWELGQRTASAGLPLALVYAVVPLVGLVMSFYALDALRGRPEEAGA